MAIRARRTLSLAGMLAAVSVLSACATTYDSAGNTYYSVWPFIGSRNPDLQLNYPANNSQLWPYPAQNLQSLPFGQDPNPFYWMYPQPPIDPRVTSPYSQAPADPEARLAAVGDNAACAEICEAKETGAPLSLRADAGDDRRIAAR
jgi:hypothetical protein